MSMSLASMLWAERMARLRFLPETVALLGWLLVGGAEEDGGEGAGKAWEEFSSWAVTAKPFRFLALVTLVSEPCAQG